jgi:hypothetical protein
MADLGTAQLSQMIRGFWVSQIVGTLARLEIADRLAQGPLEPSSLAKAIGCEPQATFRLLRAAVCLGLVTMLPDGRFDLAPPGELLRSDVPDSVRDFAIAMTAPGHWLPWGRLTEAIREGERQAVAALGHELFDYYGANPDEGSAFTGAMANHSVGVAGELAQALDTSAVNHLVDIGCFRHNHCRVAQGESGVARHNPRTRGRGSSRRSRAREARAVIAMPGPCRRFLRQRPGSRPLHPEDHSSRLG